MRSRSSPPSAATPSRRQLKGLLNNNYVNINNGVWAIRTNTTRSATSTTPTLFKDAGLDPDNPPKSWDDLRKVNTPSRPRTPIPGRICQPINNLAKTMPWVWSSGGDYWDKPILPTKANFHQPPVTDAYKFQQEWSQKQWRNTDEMTDANHCS